jgi:UDP-N-acetylmuramate--alanine ligase
LKELNDISSVYFLGIGGIGMSALARYFKSIGKQVSGYDRTETALTRSLVSEGIAVHYIDDVNLADRHADLVVWTPAIPAKHSELNYFRSNNYNVLKRSDVLGLVTRSSYNICVAGTHGKTTTSAMIAHMLRDSGKGCNAFLGGIASNYNSNFWSDPVNISVAEADEYDRSFLKLSPDVAVITAMDADHLDIYGSAKDLEDSFIAFSERIKEGGLLVYKHGLKRSNEFNIPNKISYSVHDAKSDCFLTRLEIVNGSYAFDLSFQGKLIPGFVLNMGGLHNVENAIAAFVAARQTGVSDELLQNALASFKGVKRRFEYIYRDEHTIYIDDYAHHPEELKALIGGARNLFPNRKLSIVFQPHLFSRTKDFADGFAESMDMADEVILLPIYPARELPMEGVTTELIAEKMNKIKPVLSTKADLVNDLKKKEMEVLITAGAGDIDTLVEPIKQMLASHES